MTDGLRIAHLGIAPQWAILRWAILRVITQISPSISFHIFNTDFYGPGIVQIMAQLITENN